MREVFTMWRDTRMILLVAVVAAVYAAILLPFKVFTILPGLTSVRPANAFPVVFGLMFGPAAAWGSAIGNLIADIFGGAVGTRGRGGFVGNFFFGFVGYKLWGNLGPLSSGEEPNMRSIRQVVEYVLIAVASSAMCAVIIAWVADLLGLVPFSVLAPIIMVNNTLAAAVLGPPLLYLTYPRIKDIGFLYPELLADEELSAAGASRRYVAAYGLLVVSLVWLGVGLLVGTGAAPGTLTVGLVGLVGFVLVLAFATIGAERLSAILERAGARPAGRNR
jgi:energy-coupling factor transport system substrate-specific component